MLPALSLALVLAAIAWLNPRAISYLGFNLMLNLAVPIALATVAQMFVIAGNDLDLSIGPFIGFTGCIAATWLNDTPLLGAAMLVGCIAVYAVLGALIALRNLPSIVVTLGMSFVWQGLAILLLPKPGGAAPAWLQSFMALKPPLLPFPVLAAVVIAAIAWFILMRTSYGAILRGTGGNPAAIARAGWSLLKAKMILFALAGLFGVLSGLALIGITTSGDANIGSGYTLLSIAGVILGGGEFVGGRVSPIGAVIGALTLALAASPLLTFMNIAPDWQVAANGVILIIVLAARVAASAAGGEAMTARSAGFSPNPGCGRSWARPWSGWASRSCSAAHGTGAGGMITAALALAVFTVVVGIGQMFVMTLGPGNVDLSLPANIGLGQAHGVDDRDEWQRCHGSPSGLLGAALACGLAIGAANYFLIRALRIPPIIATLSASFIIQSIDVSYGRGLQIKPPTDFADFVNQQIFGIPLMAVFAILLAAIAAIVLRRTVYGRSVLYIGQNMRAAKLAGLRLEWTRFVTYAACGMLGGLDGALLAGYFRGANVDIGNEYLLTSIAVVVIGGTSVAGGKANVPGIWGGALFLVLLLTMLNTFGASAAIRLLLTGPHHRRGDHRRRAAENGAINRRFRCEPGHIAACFR